MSQNIEVKAQVGNLEALRARAKSLGAVGPSELRQVDSYVHLRGAKLKLRRVNGGNGEAIFYRRSNRLSPKSSNYFRFHLGIFYWPILAVLSVLPGFYVSVRKTRTLYLLGQTRIHLDNVIGLGQFVEIEVVLAQGQPEDEGRRVARDLMEKLQIESEAFLPGSYSDMLAPLHSNNVLQRTLRFATRR